MSTLEAEVTTWINASQQIFNKTLRELADIENEGYADCGWDEKDGRVIFTGSGYCEDSTIAYGLALPRMFPLVEKLKQIEFMPKRFQSPGGVAFFHSILGFSIDNSDYFLDGTYGQVAVARPSVLVRPINQLPKFYKVDELAEEDVAEKMLQHGLQNPTVIDNRFCVYDFDANKLGRVLGVTLGLPAIRVGGDTRNPNTPFDKLEIGKDVMYTGEYLAKKLLSGT